MTCKKFGDVSDRAQFNPVVRSPKCPTQRRESEHRHQAGREGGCRPHLALNPLILWKPLWSQQCVARNDLWLDKKCFKSNCQLMLLHKSLGRLMLQEDEPGVGDFVELLTTSALRGKGRDQPRRLP